MNGEIASLFVRIGADTDAFEKSLRGVKSDMSALDKTVSALGTTAKLAFGVATTAIAGFSAVIAASVNKAADFEQGVADIGAMMTLTDGEAQKLGDHILDLGLDPKLKVSATEAQSAIMALGTAGLSLDQIMNGASKSTVLLANATGLSGEGGLATAATVASDVMGQFRIKAEDMDAAINQIVGTTVASKFSIEDMALAYGQVGGVAGSVGLTFEDTNAILAATATSFNSGSDAATSMKTFLQRLVPTTNDAKEAMMQLGLSTGSDFVEAFFTANGQMKSAEEIAGALSTAFSGLSDAQKIEAASTIFGTDAMRTALSLAEGGTEIIKKMKTEVGKVDAEELAAQRMDTFKGSMEVAWGIIETMSISIGQKFLPVLRPLVDTFSELAQTYGPAVVAFFGNVADTMATWIEKVKEAITGGMNPFVEKLKAVWEAGQQVWGIITQFVDSFTSMLMPVTNAIAKFLGWQDVLAAIGILLAGPILAAIGGFIAALWPVITTIAAVTAAVAALRWAWENDFAGMRTFVRGWLDKIKEWFYNDSGIWKGTWEKTMEYLSWWANGGWRTKVYAPLTMWLQELWGDIRHWTLNVKIRFMEWLQETGLAFKHGFSVVAGVIQQWAGDAKSWIVHWADGAVDKIQYWAGRADSIFTLWKNNTVAIVKEWWGNVTDWFQRAFDWWKPNEWLDKGRDIIQGLWNGMRDKWNSFTDWFRGTWEDLKNKFKNFFGIHSPSTVFAEFGSNMMEGLAQGIEGASGKVLDAMDGVTKGINDTMAGVTLATPTAGGISAFEGIGKALGASKAADFLKMLQLSGNNAEKILGAGNVEKGHMAYYFADLLKKVDSSMSLSSINSYIDDLLRSLAATSATSVSGYTQTRSNLEAMSALIDRMVASPLQDPVYEPPAPPVSPADDTTNVMVETLKMILAELRSNGAISERGFDAVVRTLGSGGGGTYSIAADNAYSYGARR